MRGFPIAPCSLALLASLVLLPATAAADVYKCTINGQVRYQDEPCPGDRDAQPHLEFEADPVPEQPAPPASTTDEIPEPEVPRGAEPKEPSPLTMLETERERRDREPPAAPPPPPKDQPLTRVAELHQQIEAAEKSLRDLVDQRRRELGDFDRRIAAEPANHQLRLDRRKRAAEYQVERIEQGQRLDALRRELDGLCPNGTLMSAGRLACR